MTVNLRLKLELVFSGQYYLDEKSLLLIYPMPYTL